MEPDENKNNMNASEARYRRLFEASRDGILILEAETGRIVDVNPYFLKLTGYKSEEILDAYIWETGPFKDTALSKNSFEALLTEKYIRYEEFSLTARNGRKINVEFVINVYGAGGQKFIQCNIRDVTTRKQAVKRIMEQRATLNAILESADFPIFSIDREYRYTAFNHAHADVMKSIYGADIHLGDNLIENKTLPEDWLTNRKNLDGAFRGETVLEMVSSGENSLECRYFEVAHHPVHTEDGSIIGVSVFAREVTARKRIEDELRFRNLILSTQQESLIDGILVVDTRGKILSSNQRFVHMWDISPTVIESKSDELVLQALKDKLVNPKEYDAKVKRLSEIPNEKSQDEIALTDGRTFDRYSAPMLGADGKHFGRVWYFRDITARKQAEDELKFSNLVLSTQQEALIDGILVVDINGKILSSNQRFVQIWGIPRDVMESQSDECVLQVLKDKLLNPDEYAAKVKHLYETPNEKSQDEIELKDGRTFDRYSAPMLGADGKHFGRVWYFRDITARKRAEDELKFSNLVLSTQQEAFIDGILVVDINGKILSSNRRFANLWGISQDVIESKSDERVLRALRDKLVSPEEYIVKVKHLYETPDETSQDEIALKDGRTFDRYSAPMIDADGKRFGRVWYFRDITSRKKVEDELRFRDRILSTQQEAAVDGILVVDTQGKILSSNQRYADMWGISHEVLESQNEERFLLSKMEKLANPEEYIKRVRTLYANPQEISRDEIALKDGRTFDRYSAPMLGADGKHFGRVWYFRDITERKRAEDKLRFTNLVLSTQQEAFIDGILVLDTQGKILSVNRRFSNLWDISNEIMESKSDERILQSLKDKLVDPEEHSDKVKHLYEAPAEISQDDIILKDGRTFDRYSAPMIGADGNNIGRVWYFRDITVRKMAEDDLKFRDRILATQLEASIDGILVVDTKGGILSNNKRFADLWSIPNDVIESKSDELVLRSLMEKLENPEEYIDKVRHLYKTPDEISRDEIALKDGRIFDRYSAPMLGADGKHFGRVWYFRDITERKRAEDKLRFTNLVLSTQQEAFIDGILVLDPQCKILSVNRRFSNLWGIPVEIMESKPDECILQAIKDKLVDPDEHVAKVKHLHEAPDEISQDDIVLKDGRVFDRYSAPMIGADGKNIGRVWYFRDVSVRKKAEDDLKFRDRILATQLEVSIDGILVVDTKGKILSSNGRFANLWGIPPDVIESRSEDRILQSLKEKLDNPDEYIAKVKHLYETPEETSQDEIILKDGRTFDRYSASMLGADGKHFGRVWYFRDVTERKQAENEVRFRDRILATQLEVSIDGILVVDTKGKILSSNRRFANLWNIPLDIIETKSDERVLQLLIAEKLENPEEYLRQVKRIHDKPDETSQDEIVLKDGRTFDRYLAPMLGADGKHFGRVWYFRDVTERKQAENELRFRDRILATQLEVSIDGILVADTKGKILSSNKRFADLWSIPKSVMESNPDERILQSRIAKNTATPEEYIVRLRHIYETPDEISQDEIALKDGRTFDRYSAPMLGADGKHFGRVWYFRDITVRKTAEDKLRLTNLVLSTQQEAFIDGILVVDTKGKILSANRRFSSLWGIPIEVMESKDDERVMQMLKDKLENPQEHITKAEHLLETPQEISQDDVALKDGRVFDRYSAPMIGADGKNFGRVWYYRDVTARKLAETEQEKLEEQLRGSQKMEAVGRLAGGVAHDFNNLLSVILSYTSFAMKGIHEGDPVKDDLLEVKKAAERAAELTRQLLAFGRKQVLQPVPLNLNHVALGIEKMLRRIIGEDIEFVQQLAPNLGVVRADRGQIEQVLMNLVINARDAMTEGGKLTIETSNVDLDAEYASRHEDVIPGPYVQLAVSDTGSGMDEKTKEKIFEPFFTTKEKGKGTGLGLATVHGIVKQSGGHIWFYSEKDHGTTFKIYLPREMAATVSTVQPAMIPRRVTGNETILVVEDEEALRKVAKRSLDAVGYKVLIAVDGDDALKIYANYKGEIKLLLTDVVMPKMSGFELAQELMKKQPNLKVLYMSGYTDNVYFHHGMLDGGVNFLGKPFTEDSLTLKVREVLDGVVAESDGKEKAFEDAALEKARLVNVEDLRSLNASTLDQLRGAVMAARYDRIVETVEGIRVAKPVLAAEIRRLADLFDYEGLKNLLGIGKA